MSKKPETPKTETAPKPNPPKNASIPLDASDAGSMDKIRDILFGNQVRDFERRFSQMEEHLNRSATDLRDEMTKRLEALERFFKEELDTVKDRIKKESEKRTDDRKHLGEELQSTSTTLNSAIQQVEEKLSERATELRQQILQQSKELISTIQNKHEQSGQSLAQVAASLDESKMDRAVMAEYLVDIAMRISNHPQAPDSEEKSA